MVLFREYFCCNIGIISGFRHQEISIPQYWYSFYAFFAIPNLHYILLYNIYILVKIISDNQQYNEQNVTEKLKLWRNFKIQCLLDMLLTNISVGNVSNLKNQEEDIIMELLD